MWFHHLVKFQWLTKSQWPGRMGSDRLVWQPGCRGIARQRAGFTLIEVMVAVAIVAIALVPLLRLHLISLDSTIWSQDYTTAVMLAQEKLAEIPAAPEAGEDKGAFNDPALSRFSWLSLVGEEEEVVLGTDTEPLVVQRVEVTIFWEAGRGSRSYKLEAYAVE